jgi:hypothetical protein
MTFMPNAPANFACPPRAPEPQQCEGVAAQILAERCLPASSPHHQSLGNEVPRESEDQPHGELGGGMAGLCRCPRR